MHRLVPETNLEALGAYRVDDRTLADAILKDLVRRGTLVTVFAGEATFCTVVEAVDPRTIDLAIGRERRHEVMGPGIEALTFVAFVEDVKIQVTARPRAAIVVDGALRLRLDRPEILHRLQRRDGFRVRPIHGEPAVCFLRAASGRYERAPILDVSVVGVGLLFVPERRLPALGATFAHCQLQLAGRELIPCDLVVKRVEPLEPGSRVGCRLVPMTRPAEQLLQRRIMGIELKRI